MITIETTDEADAEALFKRLKVFLKTLDNRDYSGREIKIIKEGDHRIKKEKKCSICESEDIYLTNLRVGFKYRCNNCGKYFN